MPILVVAIIIAVVVYFAWDRSNVLFRIDVVDGDVRITSGHPPIRFVQTLREVVRSSQTKTATIRGHKAADGATLRCAGGTVRCAAVVLATNGYAGRLTPWHAERVDPTRGQVLATAPVRPGLFDRPIYASHGFEYWRQLPTGEIVLGGWRNLDFSGERGIENALNDRIQATMEASLRRLHPALRDLVVTDRWSGIMGFSRDSLPAVGPLPGRPTLISAAGFTGHGFGFSVASGRIVADLLARGTNPWSDLLAPRRLD